jgi:hypothetical protein
MTRGTDETQPVERTANHGHRYRAEVSGWDAKENFFVEKTSLDWGEREGKTVALHVAVRVDSVLFAGAGDWTHQPVSLLETL